MSRITPKSLVPEVQNCMNNARGGKFYDRMNASWRLLLSARKAFILDQLSQLGLLPNELRQLSEIERYQHVARLELAFSSTFFEFSRTNSYWRDAVGDSNDWIQIDGMANWHVSRGLALAEKIQKQPFDLSSPADPESETRGGLVFDAVKDAAKNNISS